MAKIEIDGIAYKVVESMGYNHDVGAYAKLLETPDGQRMAVGRGKRWRFWSAADRVKPLREAVARGWRPGDPSGVGGMSKTDTSD